MAVPYAKLVADVGLRLNALAGVSSTAVEAVYVKATQVVGDYESVDFPFTACKNLVIQAEARYADIIASVRDANGKGSHPWRSLLHAVTASIAHGGIIPAVSSAADKIIG